MDPSRKRARLEPLGFVMKRKLFPVLLGFFVVAGSFASVWFSWKSRLAQSLQNGEALYGLVIGTDWVDNARHSDTIIFARYTPVSRRLDLLSIPRDTKVDIPGLRVRRINEVYAYSYKASKRNPREATEFLWGAVSNLLYPATETAKPPLHFYAQIDYDGFKKIIDLLGGVDVTVDEPMDYDDNWGKLHIHFDTGTHHLNGQKSLEYVRFRGSTGDYGRVSRQQDFLLKMVSRFTSPRSILRLPKMIMVSLKSVQTNLTGYERLLALYELRDITKDRIRLIQLPGKAQQGFWIPDPEDVQVTANFMAGKISGAEMKSSTETAAVPETEQETVLDLSKVTVEVWNASSQKGLALVVTKALRHAGFDVVKWGNYSSRQQRTMVRDHRGDPRAASGVASALKSRHTEVFTRLETNPLVDIEVILGEDYPHEK